MIITRKFLASVSPESGRYSRNLHQWLARQVDRNVDVYMTGHLVLTPKVVHPASTYLATLVEDEGWLHGVELQRALVDGGRARAWAYPPEIIIKPRLMPEFWDEYARAGVCYLDVPHDWHEERWETSGDSRRCRWCGIKQSRVRWTETVERERWDLASEVVA